MGGVAPIEGVSILAREMRAVLLARGWDAVELDTAADYLYTPGISVVHAAQAALAAAPITAMHDPTEGGVATGLLELAMAAKLGLVVDLDAIPVPTLAQRLCAEFGLDPLGVIASGALLATCAAEHADAILAAWRTLGRPGAIVGRFTDDPATRRATRGDKAVDFPYFAADEITRL
ncbi:MAG: AIR synthase-related protein, partial [Litorilinea sp.]